MNENSNVNDSIKINGTVAPGFEKVRDAYKANFSRGDLYEDLGSSLCVYHRGERVVDLWAGWKDIERTQAWQEDTTICIYSTTKGIAGICLAVLVDQGLLNYSDLASKYWPEYGCNGKESTTIAHMLSHQTGTPAVREATQLDDLMNWDLICERLATQEPYWVPGENTAYHGWTYGYLVGEIVRRITGKSIGQFLQEEIAGPMSAELYIGMPPEKDAAAAMLYRPKQVHTPPEMEGEIPQFLIDATTNPVLDAESPNRPEWRAAEMPATCGYASAQGLAKIYAALAQGGSAHGVDLMSTETIAKMTSIASNRVDALLGMEMNWAHGVLLNNLGLYGPNPNAFGYSGWGGSLGCADPENQIAIGFVCNQMGPDFVGDARTLPLMEAIYASLS